MKRLFILSALLLSLCTLHANDTIRVLCLGNSFTFFYDSHEKLVSIAASQGHTILMNAKYVGGYTFYRHLNDLRSLQAIEDALYVGEYDCAFLQNQSQAFARYAKDPKQYRLEKSDTQELVARVREHSPHARIWLEQTWSYSAGNYGGFGSFEAFDRYMKKGTAILAKSSKTQVSPIGEAFIRVRAERPDINLYEPDCKHQSLAGTYLKSCVNYLLIYRTPFVGEVDNAGLDPAIAAYLRQVAEQIILH